MLVPGPVCPTAMNHSHWLPSKQINLQIPNPIKLDSPEIESIEAAVFSFLFLFLWMTSSSLFVFMFLFCFVLTRGQGQDSVAFTPQFPLPNDSTQELRGWKWNSNKAGEDMNVCFRISRTPTLEVAKVVFVYIAEIGNTWKLWSARCLGGTRHLYITFMGGQASCSRPNSWWDKVKVYVVPQASLVCSGSRAAVPLSQISSDWWLSSGRGTADAPLKSKLYLETQK